MPLLAWSRNEWITSIPLLSTTIQSFAIPSSPLRVLSGAAPQRAPSLGPALARGACASPRQPCLGPTPSGHLHASRRQAFLRLRAALRSPRSHRPGEPVRLIAPLHSPPRPRL